MPSARGLAGLAGAFLSQIGNVGPSLGQNYIVDSFMTVVVGGVGSIIGTVCSALGIGTADQVLQQLLGSPVSGKIIVLVGDHPVPAMEARRLVRHPQPQPGLTICDASQSNYETRGWLALAALIVIVILPALNAFTPEASFLHVSNFTINL